MATGGGKAPGGGQGGMGGMAPGGGKGGGKDGAGRLPGKGKGLSDTASDDAWHEEYNGWWMHFENCMVAYIAAMFTAAKGAANTKGEYWKGSRTNKRGPDDDGKGGDGRGDNKNKRQR